MAGFRKVTPGVFDAAVMAFSVRDEHDFLESRFLDRNGQVVAKVIRFLDDDEELLPEADLLIADPLPRTGIGKTS
ncbi:MAG: hypothetical protein CMQ20_07135 [Gammaproteobacteria bacterium]|jgi:hypothetical protein|nr:hypothetical protein [Gammaproteobacteria bacterium]|tara:strand:- start:85 stop:309 length:225 start_codon:yes stop_codon:yes gene_type:complete